MTMTTLEVHSRSIVLDGRPFAYLERVRQAALMLVADRHVLEADVDAIVERAGRRYDLFEKGL